MPLMDWRLDNLIKVIFECNILAGRGSYCKVLDPFCFPLCFTRYVSLGMVIKLQVFEVLHSF